MISSPYGLVRFDRKHLRCLPLFALFLAISVPAFSKTIQARRAEDFIDSMGINVHMEYTDSPYGDYPKINQKLQALGMRHFRDEINDTGQSFIDEIQTIGSLGYSMCGLIEGGNDYPPHGHRLEAKAVVPMIQRLLPVIEAVEGPNEPDNPTFLYDGVPYPQGAINESADLWQIVKDHDVISSLPVLAMSEGNGADFKYLAAATQTPIPFATDGNMHAYQGGSVGDYQLADYYIPFARLLTGDDVLWTTEMGYHNNTNYLSDGEQQGVSERAASIYLPIAFLSGFTRRVYRTFSYELIDETYDPTLTSGSGNGHYGLLNYDGSPKLAYTALENLIQILSDADGGSFQPGALVIKIADAPSTVGYTLLQKSNGDYYLAIWNDVSVYQIATSARAGENVYPPAVPITLTVSGPRSFTVYAPNDSAQATNAYTQSIGDDSITLALPPQVLLLKISSHDQ